MLRITRPDFGIPLQVRFVRPKAFSAFGCAAVRASRRWIARRGPEGTVRRALGSSPT